MHRRPSVLMYFFFFWNERLTPIGHCLSVFLFFLLFVIWVLGFYTVKIFLLLCSAFLIFSLFTLVAPKGIILSGVRVPKVREGEDAEITANLYSE